MAQYLDPLLIDASSDFSEFRKVTANVDTAKLSTFIREAQVKEMRAFLGDELYHALITDYNANDDTFGAQRFTDLWFGVETYEVNGRERVFHGLKPAITYFAYERFLNELDNNVTRFGNRTQVNELSDPNTVQQVRTKGKDAASMGILYQQDAWTYLDQNRDTYPEFERNEPRQEKKTSFNFWRV